ncbi:hypothetical protein HA402_011096 [Bradysia odoriphaga]|nr:hypothetical protein HA402_011096 [Bradysia odoriphaga]
MLLENDLAGLIVTLAVASSLNNILSKTFEFSTYVFSKYTSASIEIHTPNVMSWLQEFVGKKCGERLCHYRLITDIASRRSDEDSMDKKKDKQLTENDKDLLEIQKQLDPLTMEFSVFFWYKGTLIRVIREKGRRTSYTYSDKFTITAYGIRKKQVLLEMIAEAKNMANQRPEHVINFYRADATRGIWNKICKTKARPLSSIVLCKGVVQSIRKDVEDFLECRQWYKERGIPYRRGYLLYGPPGCGKTSFVKGIAGQIGYNIYELPLSSPSLTDEQLNNFMKSFEPKSILLFEDIDSTFSARIQDEERAGEHDAQLGKLSIREAKSGVTFSGLLNAIDGVASEEDYIIFMTTNHLKRLDPALIRPGRIDFKQIIDYPDQEQIEAFTMQFYTDCNSEIASAFAEAVKKLNCNPSMAQIQGLFLKHKNEPEALLSDVQTLVDISKDNVDLSHRNFYI